MPERDEQRRDVGIGGREHDVATEVYMCKIQPPATRKGMSVEQVFSIFITARMRTVYRSSSVREGEFSRVVKAEQLTHDR